MLPLSAHTRAELGGPQPDRGQAMLGGAALAAAGIGGWRRSEVAIGHPKEGRGGGMMVGMVIVVVVMVIWIVDLVG